MRVAEWIQLIFSSLLGVAAWFRPLPLKRRIKVSRWALGVISAIGMARFAAGFLLALHSSVLRDWPQHYCWYLTGRPLSSSWVPPKSFKGGWPNLIEGSCRGFCATKLLRLEARPYMLRLPIWLFISRSAPQSR